MDLVPLLAQRSSSSVLEQGSDARGLGEELYRTPGGTTQVRR